MRLRCLLTRSALILPLLLAACSAPADPPRSSATLAASPTASTPTASGTTPSSTGTTQTPTSPAPSSTAPSSTTPSSPPTAAPLRFAVIGDSLAFGSFATTAARSYRLLLVAALQRQQPVDLETGFRLVNVDRLSLARSLVAVPDDLDVAVLELGSNDARHGTSLTRFRQDYDAMLALVQQHSPHVQLVCMGTWWGRAATFAAGSAADYDGVISRLCRDHGGQFVGVRDLFDQPGLRGPAGRSTYRGRSDGYHPNDAGHAALARRLLPAVRAAVARLPQAAS